jgi:hypothetical protein
MEGGVDMLKIELDSIIYECPEEVGYSEKDLILLVKEQEGDIIQWVPLAKGWEYSLWHRIGERGGMAEAGEILLSHTYEHSFPCTIEAYIQRYRNKIANRVPIKEILSRFEVKVVAWHLKEMPEEYYKERIPKAFEEYGLTLEKEDGDKLYFQWTIKDPSEFAKIPIEYSDLDQGYFLKMVFTEKLKEKQNFSTVFSEPSQYTTLF